MNFNPLPKTFAEKSVLHKAASRTEPKKERSSRRSQYFWMLQGNLPE